MQKSRQRVKDCLGELKNWSLQDKESTLTTPAKGLSLLNGSSKGSCQRTKHSHLLLKKRSLIRSCQVIKQFFNCNQAAPVQQTQTTDEKPGTVDQQILNTWKQMKFTPFGNSSGRFTVRLNPENLGFITIQLTKQNGMYASKITASTQAARSTLSIIYP
ncbi:flagellar hook-length control protein FliK [Bacillus sp. SL00103]